MTIPGSPQRRLRLAAGVCALAFVLALVGLHGNLAAAEPTATASKVARVDIDHFAFSPATLTVAKGSTVTFTNSSQVTHTATRDGVIDTGLIKPGKSAAVRLKQKGTFTYRCLIHPLMHGKIVVD